MTPLLEFWKPIHGYEGIYEISCVGNVRRLIKRGRYQAHGMLRYSTNPDGYHMLVLCREGVTKTVAIHTLVAEAFHGCRPYGFETNHKNCRKSKNWASNLEYVTPTENKIHAREWYGTSFGSASGAARLDAERVLTIREQAKTMKYSDIAKGQGLGRAHVRKIVLRKLWNRV